MFNLLHLELTSRCNKACWMCGRRKMERDHPELCDWGDMTAQTVWTLSKQVPRGTVVQLHNNGEPTCYLNLGWALKRFDHCIRQFNTNGKLLLEKAHEIIGNLEILTISVIENDSEGEEQYEIVKKFLEIKGHGKPQIIYRALGEIADRGRWEILPGRFANRILHAPEGSHHYSKPPTIPEIGICMDLLTHLAVDRKGNISLCVRFDPGGDLRLGNIKNMTLEEAWNGDARRLYVERHVRGERELCPGCDRCDYYGIPRGE